MPDICMCGSKQCPSFNRCYRAIAIPSPYNQTYSDFDPVGCEYFIDVKRDFNKTAFNIEEDNQEPFRG